MASGRALSVLGPSGAGKSTLLRVLAGLDIADSGHVRLDDRDVTDLPAERRNIALVFQNDALFPHLSVAANLAFSPRLVAASPANKRERILEIASALDIDSLLDARPRDLSTGERQRASLARALLSAPAALLLDEPFAHLDPPLRLRTRDYLTSLQHRFHGPTIYVTHDHAEAMANGSMLAVLIDGRIQQCDRPERVYDRPETLDVARFVGNPPMNIVADGTRAIGVRAENIRIEPESPRRSFVQRYEWLGADAFVWCESSWGKVAARVAPGAPRHAAGEEIGLAFAPGSERYFDAATGCALPG